MFNDLIDENNENEMCKTIFALTGCILYQFQCIESALSTLIAWKKLSPIMKHIDQSRWDHELIHLKENETLGNLYNILKENSWISQELLNELEQLLGFRNFLMHRYFKDNSTSFCSIKGKQDILKFLKDKSSILENFDEKLSLLLRENIPLNNEDILTQIGYLECLVEYHNIDISKQTAFLKNKEGVKIIEILTNSLDSPEKRSIYFVTDGGQILALGNDSLILKTNILRNDLKPFNIERFKLPQTYLPQKTSCSQPWNYVLHFKSGVKLEISTHSKGYLIAVK